MGKILDEQLEALRKHLEARLSLEEQRLGKGLKRIAESKIVEIKARAEESITKASQQYETAMAKADAMAQDPSMSFLAEQMRESAKRQFDVTIRAHRTIAEGAIRSIHNLMR